jgi:glycosyltransferase involved in cell wall biosynthesis
MGKVAPRIALIHDFLTAFGGAERVLLEFHTMYPNAPIYTTVADAGLVTEYFPKADIRTSYLQKSWRRKNSALFILALPAAIESFDLREFDIVLSSSGAYSLGVITGPATTHICYCHTPQRRAWDWHAEFIKERGLDRGWFRPLLTNQLVHQQRNWDYLASKRVDVWIGNSKTVVKRIRRYYGVDAVAITPPIRTTYFDPTNLSTKPERGEHMLSISRISVTKRLEQIVEASAQTGIPVRIGGLGDQAWLMSLIEKSKAPVTFLGEVSEAEKRIELASARAFLFPAEDDFGIAPVEAMAMGTPVIALGKGGATETVLDGVTGTLYPESSSASLATAMRECSIVPDTPAIRQQALRFGEEAFRQAIRAIVDAHS